MYVYIPSRYEIQISAMYLFADGGEDERAKTDTGKANLIPG